MTAAAYLPPPPRPPHDPLWQSLGPRTGWRLAERPVAALPRLATDAASSALVLPALPGTARTLGEPTGSLGGLVLPGTLALDQAGNLWLLDRRRKRLRLFDRCACRFRDLPCQGVALADPRAVAIERGRLYLVDAGPPGRVLVLDARSLTLRAVWSPPAAATAQPWQPTAVATRAGTLWVADAANGALHRFAPWGGWRGAQSDVGAVSRLAFDCEGRLYAVVPGRESVDVRSRDGRLLGQPGEPGAVADRFPEPIIPVAPDGAVELSGLCPDAGWFDLSGEPVAAPAGGPSYVTGAAALTRALDSRIARCQWHRIRLDASLPTHGALRIETTTAETDLPESMVAELPDAAWTALPLAPGAKEALILSPPGRYLWLRLTLTGDGAATPVLCALEIEYPRISLRRYLPAAFGGDPLSAAFLDRFLGIFDRGLRDLEATVDDQAALFDPRSTPAEPGRDMLSWLATWVGVTLDKRWPVARRRRLLRSAARLFACRGTWPGLRQAVLLWLGWDRLEGLAHPPAACAPACSPPAACPPLPPLVLEHWKLRRWLFLGAGRLGDAAELWGARILGNSQLDATARADVTRLDVTRDPLRGPFHVDAHRASLFVPAHAVATPQGRGALNRLLAEQLPAHVKAQLVPVAPRMRIGIQASLGFDSVVGCWPPSLSGDGFALGAVTLGRASVLPGAGGPGGLPPRLGRDSRLRPGAPASSPPSGEAQS
ncbi:phage tail protein domain-containing protein [Tistlia consotensis]|uniref:Phage tail protein domain-containing protein n=1 Tax=Tistlia consotensis USBA 355 TaxID=560819 RepID=A0A1Y6BD69_9PROT|nr:phage tail protein [Tistlia consotensis]SMF03060.1 phage tail protein domain-containing protein [Tistlia consotensis USBA 355]SNR53393.1 phage tail protein domain-containing protein [Tistlia consotensis]